MFPQRIASNSIIIDDVGLSLSERNAIIGASKILKKDLQKHANKLNALFFEENSEYLKYFFNSKRDNTVLHNHGHRSLLWIISLIDDGLHNADIYHTRLDSLTQKHKEIGLNTIDIQQMLNIFEKYFLKVLKRYLSPTLKRSLSKFFNNIAVAYDKR